MSSLCVSSDEKHSSKQAIFSLIRNRMKNESYLTQWHTEYFPNITLVSLYSKPVRHENSRCLHFVSVQVKHIVQNRQFYSLTQKKMKNESFLIQWDTKGFQNIKLVCLYSKSMSHENSKCHFASVQVKQVLSMACFALCFTYTDVK